MCTLSGNFLNFQQKIVFVSENVFLWEWMSCLGLNALKKLRLILGYLSLKSLKSLLQDNFPPQLNGVDNIGDVNGSVGELYTPST